jgi:hypothetical protein
LENTHQISSKIAKQKSEHEIWMLPASEQRNSQSTLVDISNTTQDKIIGSVIGKMHRRPSIEMLRTVDPNDELNLQVEYLSSQ